MEVFKKSEEVLKRVKRMQILMYIGSFLFLLGLTFLNIKFNKLPEKVGLISFAFSIIFIFSILIIMGFKTFKSLRRAELVIDSGEIIKKYGNVSESIILSELSSLKIIKYKEKVLSIKVTESGKTLLISGYSDMNKIALILEGLLKDSDLLVIVKKTSDPTDQASRVISIFMGLGIFLSLVFLALVLPKIFHVENRISFNEMWDTFIISIIGISLLIYHPFSTLRRNKFRKVEVGLGLLLILISLIKIIFPLL